MEQQPRPPASVEEAVQDVAFRFIENLPAEELTSVDRVFFQVQQAHWFYEDFFVDEHAHLHHMSLKEFTKVLFERCAVLEPFRERHADYLAEFREYMGHIPVFGGILLNKDMTRVLLVQGWGGRSWGFPKGKINEGEGDMECAIREVFEEIGFDMRPYVNKRDHLNFNNGTQPWKLFIAVGVPEDDRYAPITRKEIRQCRWFTIDDLPKSKRDRQASRFWSIRPFLPRLRQWVQKRSRGKKGRGAKRKKTAPTASSAPLDVDDHDRVTFGLSSDAAGGWSVTEMFSRNEQLTGQQFSYRGNPHEFGTEVAATGGGGGGKSKTGSSATGKRRRQRDRDTFGAVSGGWTPAEMFEQNERLASAERERRKQASESGFRFDVNRIMMAVDAALAAQA